MSVLHAIRALFGGSRPSQRAAAGSGADPAAEKGSAASRTSGGALTSGLSRALNTSNASKTSGASGPASAAMAQGFLVFEQTGDVLAAERLLRREGFQVEVKAPPASLRRGCDMVVVCPIMSHVQIEGLLQRAGLVPLEFVPVSDPLLAPVSLFQVTDYGEWFMVRAANMKVTVARADGRIVNISGGGCPDVPYLAGLLQGKCLDEADEPRLHGKTLCSYALQRAFEEAGRIWRG